MKSKTIKKDNPSQKEEWKEFRNLLEAQLTFAGLNPIKDYNSFWACISGIMTYFKDWIKKHDDSLLSDQKREWEKEIIETINELTNSWGNVERGELISAIRSLIKK